MTAVASPTALASRRVWECMGTVFSVDVRGAGVDPTVLDEQVAFTHAVDARFSTYRPDSEISRLAANRMSPAECSPWLHEVLARCAELGADTGGYFDAYAGGSLDPSGYVKGWAIQRVSDALRSAGSSSHCVNGGGDVQCIGSAGPDEPWRVGIAHPLEPDRFVDVVAGAGALAVATSGTAERGHHVLDPHEPGAAPVWASVTVVGTQIHLVDAYATAACAMGEQAPHWLRSNGFTAVLVRTDGEVLRIVPEAQTR